MKRLHNSYISSSCISLNCFKREHVRLDRSTVSASREFDVWRWGKGQALQTQICHAQILFSTSTMINCFSLLKQLTGLTKLKITIFQWSNCECMIALQNLQTIGPRVLNGLLLRPQELIIILYIIIILECVQSGATSELRCQQLNHLNNFKEKYQVSSKICCQLSNCDEKQPEKDKRVLHKELSLFLVQVDTKWVAASYSGSDFFICLCWFFCIFFFNYCCSTYTNHSCLRPHFWDLAQRPHPRLTSAAISSRQSGQKYKEGW